LKVQVGKYFEKGGAGGIVEASEGGVVDCTGSEFSFVVVSGEVATGSAASGAAASGAAAPGVAASGAGCRAEAGGDGEKKSTGAVVGEGGSGVARIGEDGPGGGSEGGVRGGSTVLGDCCSGDGTICGGDP
jgi:hypothetical protein